MPKGINSVSRLLQVIKKKFETSRLLKNFIHPGLETEKGEERML